MAKRSKLLVRKDVLQIERESVIMTMKPKLVMGLADLLAVNSDREEFLKLCKRIEAIVRAWYHLQFEDLLELYTLFDPVHGAEKLEKQNIPPARVDNLEQRFLQILFQIMEKSNYKVLSDEEVEIATSGQYLLNLPITVDGSKLDDKLFTRFFKENSISGLPQFANQYIIFRQGVGIDRTTRFFFAEKLDALISRFWNWFLTRLRLRKVSSGELLHLRDPDGIAPGGNDSNYNLCIERIHIKTMDLSFGNIFGRITIQEPTFERMILVYRGATTKNDAPKYGNRAICIKHFRHIPMADMELVLPEKKNPSLTPMDWTKLLISAILGLVTLVTSMEMPKADFWVFLPILAAVIGYCVKIFFTFQQNLAEYQNLITRCMYDKQLDSGRGTLLHLCDDVIQQEVKEVILAYFMLMTQGKATEDELDRRCEELMLDEFNEICDFDVHDAVAKLERLGIVTRDSLGWYRHQALNRANEIIGITTEELVGRVLSSEEIS